MSELKLVFRIKTDRRDVYDRTDEVMAANKEWVASVVAVEQEMGRKWDVRRYRDHCTVMGPKRDTDERDERGRRKSGEIPIGWAAFKTYDYLKPVKGPDGDAAREVLKSLQPPIQILRAWCDEFGLPRDSFFMRPEGPGWSEDGKIYEWGFRRLDDLWYVYIGGGQWGGNDVFEPLKRSEWYALLEAAGIDT